MLYEYVATADHVTTVLAPNAKRPAIKTWCAFWPESIVSWTEQVSRYLCHAAQFDDDPNLKKRQAYVQAAVTGGADEERNA